jgi:hypothetical protein
MLSTPSRFVSSVLVTSVLVATMAATVVSAGCASVAPKPSEHVTEQSSRMSSPALTKAASATIDESLDHFIADGWVVFSKARADLDQDGRQDMVVLVEHQRSGKSVDGYPTPRTRYVLIVVQDEPFARLAAMNPDILRQKREFGMYPPTVQIDAAHGEFAITQSGGTSGRRWLYTLTFRHERARSAWYVASCSFETNSHDVRGRPQTSTGEHSYPYTLKNDFGHFDRDEFEGFCPKL